MSNNIYSENQKTEEEVLDPVAVFITDALENLTSTDPVTHERVAKAFWETRRKANDKPDAWRKYLNCVKQQAIFLARRGDIELTRRGEVVDPNNFKGLVRLRITKK